VFESKKIYIKLKKSENGDEKAVPAKKHVYCNKCNWQFKNI
jgi:hypothetical protein